MSGHKPEISLVSSTSSKSTAYRLSTFPSLRKTDGTPKCCAKEKSSTATAPRLKRTRKERRKTGGREGRREEGKKEGEREDGKRDGRKER